MRYTIYNKESKQYEMAHDCVVTQDGEIAFWSDSQGWDIWPNQDIFIVEQIQEERE